MTCCCSKTDNPTCVCVPYQDGFLIAAQIISIVAFLFSWTWWLTFVDSLIQMILLQAVWCLRLNKKWILALAVTCGITSILCLFSGIWMLVVWKDFADCTPFYWISFYEDSFDTLFEEPIDFCNEGVWASIAFADMVLWSIVTACLLNFVYSGRHQECEDKWGTTDAEAALPTAQA